MIAQEISIVLIHEGKKTHQIDIIENFLPQLWYDENKLTGKDFL